MKKLILFLVLCLGLIGLSKNLTLVYAEDTPVVEEIESVEEEKTALASWLEEKFSAILTGLVSVVGSGTVLAFCIKWLKQHSSKLIDLGVKYGKDQTEMEKIVNDLNEASDKFANGTLKATEKVTECIGKVEDLEKAVKDKLDTNNDAIKTILNVLKLISANDSNLVENGTASEIAKQLNEVLKQTIESENVEDEKNIENNVA